MSIEQSERIRAALLRSKTNRPSGETPTLDAVEESDATPSKAADEQEGSTIFAKRAAAEQAPVDERQKTPEVEATLPLVGASEKARAVFKDNSGPAGLLGHLPNFDVPIAATVGEPSRGNLKRNILIGCGVLALAGLLVFLVWGPWRTIFKPSETAAGASVPLQMRVESQGKGIINIRWNEHSTAVVKAREGRMVIMERDQQPRIITLGPDQLKIGHLYYQTPVDRVEFRLEVVEASGAVAKESVLALASGLAAEPAAGPPVPPGANPSKQEKEQTAAAEQAPKVEAKTETPRIEKTVVSEQPSRPAARPFTPPSLERKSEEPRVVVLDPPAAVATGSLVPPVSLPDAATRIAAPPGKEAPPPKQIKVGGNLETANLIKKVAPVYPPMARSTGVQGTVRFMATIGKDGTIQNIQVLSGNPLLVSAASDAVKKWVYRPTLLDGEPVEVITQIDVNFSLKK